MAANYFVVSIGCMNSFLRIWMDFQTEEQYKSIGISSCKLSRRDSQIHRKQVPMGKKMLMFYVQRINAIETVTPD